MHAVPQLPGQYLGFLMEEIILIKSLWNLAIDKAHQGGSSGGQQNKIRGTQSFLNSKVQKTCGCGVD